MPIVVQTNKCTPNEPILSKDCIAALRAHIEKAKANPQDDAVVAAVEPEEDSEVVVEEDSEGETFAPKRKRLRKSNQIVEDED